MITLPGEKIPVVNHEKVKIIRKQFVINPDESSVIARHSGLIIDREVKGEHKLGLLTRPKKYLPEAEDFVVGIIKSRENEAYLVDIGGPTIARLGETEFQGASKRNKPNLEEGALIYARVLEHNKFERTTLTCISTKDNKQWTTGESFFGELKGGFVFPGSISFCRDLLDKRKTQILDELKKHVAYEVAVGINGKFVVLSDVLNKMKDLG
eukprot:TRINITY_DN5819_c0_g1_i8.p1 TRINITY_DN5819_c0_g1~~TRINITY_DN5819_c0_g1_i8.p1  ORF type:complete len:210 (+),score=48.54 TRINITY_DN5819_c0_g1_i8:44-673(+)